MEASVKVVKVWDPFIRIFHWSMVALFIIAYLTAEELEGAHALTGYAVSGLLVLRLIWGFIGTKYARFSDFVYPPREIVRYVKGLISGRPEHYLGHNPAGGLMVIILLIALSAACFSGLKAYGAEGHGPFAGETHLASLAHADDDEDNGQGERNAREGEEEFWEEVHEITVNITLILIAMHIAGVLVSSYMHKENLIKAMITGKKET